MNAVMIIPTGIGCGIGGNCGDANAAARLLASCCDTLILHPKAVNTSDMLMTMQAGVHPSAVRRPLKHTIVK